MDDVDIMMGTFTKSFGSAGGYIAADKVRNADIVLELVAGGCRVILIHITTTLV